VNKSEHFLSEEDSSTSILAYNPTKLMMFSYKHVHITKLNKNVTKKDMRGIFKGFGGHVRQITFNLILSPAECELIILNSSGLYKIHSPNFLLLSMILTKYSKRKYGKVHRESSHHQ